MKTININFDKNSIQNAIKELNQVQKKMQSEVPSAFLSKCLDWIQNRANTYLESFLMSSDIIVDIQSKWEKQVIGSNAILRNTSEKAVYIEFGVGVVGQQSSHPNANQTGYEYNIDSGKKDQYGQWRFVLDDDEGVDLNVGYYNTKATSKGKLIKTKGSPANLYLYNAAMDFTSTGAYKTLWKETLDELL